MPGFRSWAIDETEYSSLPFCPDGISRVPPSARETLRDAITADDFEYALGQLPNNRVPGPGVPFEFLRHAPSSMKETIGTCISSIYMGLTPVKIFFRLRLQNFPRRNLTYGS